MADSGSPGGDGATKPLWKVVSALGLAQIISWGTLYYSLTVLSTPIEAELGFSKLVTFGAFTLGLLASGFVAPIVGRRIDSEGGQRTMTAGSLLAAVALLIVASAREPIVFSLGWIVAGIAMGATLYDPVFASIFAIAGDRYRKAITGLTLFGGFASTVFWPTSHELATTIGWRWTLVFYAGLHLAICLPIHWRMLRVAHPRARATQTSFDATPKPRDSRFTWLAASFACVTLVFGSLSAFIVQALTSRGFSVEAAVWIAALVGPMQVLARAIEWIASPRISAISVGTLAFALSLTGMVFLSSAPASILVGAIFAICYGASNGILTIARGAVPVELFGPQRQGAMLGALARPSFFTKAFAPALFAGGLSIGISMRTQLLALVTVSVAALGCYLMATRSRSSVVVSSLEQ